MKIIKQYNWSRRDFCYDAKCEHCNHIEKNISGYDDDNYYNTVIPGMICKSCGESTVSKPSGELTTIIVPKYNPTQTV